MDVSDAAKIALVEASGTQGSTVLGKSANRSGAKQAGIDCLGQVRPPNVFPPIGPLSHTLDMSTFG